jgi:two-component system, NarL family, sensor histidine kinase EvgS
VEAGKLRIEMEAFSVRELIDDLRLFFIERAKEKGLTLEFRVSERLPDVLVLDAARLRQILLNLIGNALKFTDQGRVACAVTGQMANSQGEATIRVDVTDTGMGVSDEFKERLFGAFEQPQGQDHSRYGGTGLGLAISQRLAELMNGRITVADNPAGQGSVFTLELQRVEIKEADETPRVSEALFDRCHPAVVAAIREMGWTERIRATAKSLRINQITDLGRELEAFGAERQMAELSAWGTALVQAAESFQIERLKTMLAALLDFSVDSDQSSVADGATLL